MWTFPPRFHQLCFTKNKSQKDFASSPERGVSRRVLSYLSKLRSLPWKNIEIAPSICTGGAHLSQKGSLCVYQGGSMTLPSGTKQQKSEPTRRSRRSLLLCAKKWCSLCTVSSPTHQILSTIPSRTFFRAYSSTLRPVLLCAYMDKS